MALWLLEKVSRGWPAKDEAIPKIQTGQRQVFEYQEGGMAFGLGYGTPSLHLTRTIFPLILAIRKRLYSFK